MPGYRTDPDHKGTPSAGTIILWCASLLMLVSAIFVALRTLPTSTLAQSGPMPQLANGPDRPMFQVETGLPPKELPAEARQTFVQTVPLFYANADPHGTGESHATGFIFRDGIVIGPAHLLEPVCGPTLYAYCNGALREAEVLLMDSIRDVVVASAPECHGTTLQLADRHIAHNERLYRTGFTFPQKGLATRYTYDVRAIDGPGENLAEYQDCDVGCRETVLREHIAPLRLSTGHVEHGMSGSPIFTEDGEIVGITVRFRPGVPIAVYVPASLVRTVLTRAGIRDP